jgi:peptide/nickel transport system substrate-binding protein
VLDELVIDLSGDPDSIDPAVAYSARDWSIVHSIYDGLVTIAEDGSVQPLAAESFKTIDDVTFEARLREGLTFHDGSPVTSNAAVRGFEHLQGADSLVIDLFSSIVDLQRVDDLTLRIVCDQPSPWLPAQMAVWHMLLPENADADSITNAPVGNGPYRFVSWEKGSRIELERFDAYQPNPAKGAPLANAVTYRFVPEATTRVADVVSGSTQIASEIPLDQHEAVKSGGANVVSSPIVGSAWIRIATDTKPFDDVRVRQALNLALDVDAMAKVFVGEEAHRLASIHPDDRSMGFDPNLAPYGYDPGQTKALLEEAGYGDGLDVVFEITTAASQAMAEAMSAQWAEAGIRAELKVSEYAAFNANWADPTAPVLKMSTWSPLYDPHTLLNLVFASEGFLSRYDNAEASELITAAGAETDPQARAEHYRQLAAVMHEDAAAIFLWNLIEGYGVREEAGAWKPRGDEYVLPLSR